ncbi:MAG: DUF4976 domain-containing protein [Chloroflexota bacterium]
MLLLNRRNGGYSGIRTPEWKYVEHYNKNNELELYDLVNDPYELENIVNIPAYSGIREQLAQRMRELLDESTPIPPPPPPPPELPDAILLLSSTTNGTVGGVNFADEDILAYDTTTGVWSMYFDGSEFGLGSSDINAFHQMDDGSLLFSLDRPVTLDNLGRVDDSDILRYVPASSDGLNPAYLEWYFDGSAVGLTTAAEDIDAIAVLEDGRLVVSPIADGARVPINDAVTRVRDEDLIAFTGETGANTTGTWELFFDGSDIGLTAGSEDINAVNVAPDGTLYLSTYGKFKLIGGLSGTKSDILACVPDGISTGLDSNCEDGLGIFVLGSDIGFQKESIDGLQVILP